jgi:hypothetical protein
MLRTAPQRTLARAALVVALVVAGLGLRSWVSCSAELARAEELRDGGDVEAAIDHYRRAATWYFPGNVRARAALEELVEIGTGAEARGESTIALAAFRSARGAAMAARGVYLPHADVVAVANERIAALMAEGAVPPVDADRSPEERREAYLAMLRADRDVRTGWALVALLGFACWVSGASLLARRGVDERDEVAPREARRWGTLLVVGLGLFVLGLALA